MAFLAQCGKKFLKPAADPCNRRSADPLDAEIDDFHQRVLPGGFRQRRKRIAGNRAVMLGPGDRVGQRRNW
jgi:hypothetical protein